ncbi:MAG: hypothetical protein OXF79_23755, partial [Chloroflexi bacterium]|nr:hypothetical protein [Chloroflexota bacterium]
FDIVVPGHGPPMTDLSPIEKSQDYYRALWERTAAMHASGVSVEEAIETIDMSDTGFRNPSDVEVQRMYDRLENPD